MKKTIYTLILLSLLLTACTGTATPSADNAANQGSRTCLKQHLSGG